MENLRRKRLMNQFVELEIKLRERLSRHPDDVYYAECLEALLAEIKKLKDLHDVEFFEYWRRTYGAMVTLALILLFSVQCFAQNFTKTIPPEVINVFQNARCACSAAATATVATFPASYRSHFVNSVYTETDGFIPFQMYYSPDVGQQLNFHAKGFCRHISLLIPMPRPGFYFVRFFHQGKPALIEIDARKPTIYVKAFGKCEIHE